MNILDQLTEMIQPEQELEQLEQLEEQLELDPPIETETVEGESLYCSVCDWKTHAGAKNKYRGLKDHIRKNHPDEYKNLYPTKKQNTKNKKQNKPIQKNIVLAPPKITEEYDKIEDKINDLDEDEIRQKLIGDLDLFKIKFSHIEFGWSYNSTSSVKHLRRQKALFLRVLNDEASTQAVFNMLVVASKGAERLTNISGLADIDGYSNDIKESRSEIYPILQNMVDSGNLDVSHLTPELRLGLIMGSCLVSRLEKNRVNLNGEDPSVEDGEFV